MGMKKHSACSAEFLSVFLSDSGFGLIRHCPSFPAQSSLLIQSPQCSLSPPVFLPRCPPIMSSFLNYMHRRRLLARSKTTPGGYRMGRFETQGGDEAWRSPHSDCITGWLPPAFSVTQSGTGAVSSHLMRSSTHACWSHRGVAVSLHHFFYSCHFNHIHEME